MQGSVSKCNETDLHLFRSHDLITVRITRWHALLQIYFFIISVFPILSNISPGNWHKIGTEFHNLWPPGVLCDVMEILKNVKYLIFKVLLSCKTMFPLITSHQEPSCLKFEHKLTIMRQIWFLNKSIKLVTLLLFGLLL